MRNYCLGVREVGESNNVKVVEYMERSMNAIGTLVLLFIVRHKSIIFYLVCCLIASFLNKSL